MMTSMSPFERYATADSPERRELLKKPDILEAVRGWLGEDAFAEFSGLPSTAPHLGVPQSLLFVPGIMGSLLISKLGGLWWLDLARARDKLNGLALAPDGVEDEDAAAGIGPCGIDLSYEAFSRAVGSERTFGYENFPFDWRRLVTTQTELLKQRILELAQNSQKPVHLVAHSLGGLMIRATLMKHGAELWPHVGKIVFIGTPHYGSPSIAGYLKNHLWGWNEMAVLGHYLSRRAFRSMWGALSLLPAPVGVYPETTAGSPHPCANFDMYSVADWKLDLPPDEAQNLQSILDAVGSLHGSLKDWHQTVTRDQCARMLVIAGVGYSSLFRLEYDSRFWGAWEYTKRYTERYEGAVNYEGDGRVSVASAALERVEVRYVKGRHGSLPNLPSVSRDVLAWLKGERLQLSASIQGALTSHLAAARPSPTPRVEGFAPGDDGYDRYRDIPAGELAALKEQFEAGNLPNVQFARLL